MLWSEAQAECCEPSDKASCCGEAAAGAAAVARREPQPRRGDPRGGSLSLRGRRDQGYRAQLLLRAGRRPHRRGSRGLRRLALRRAGTSCPTRRRWPRSAAATRPRSPSCGRARPCSTSAPAEASTSCSPPSGSARRQGLRPRHDRRDARPGAGEPAQGRASRTSSGCAARSSRSRCPPRPSTW